MSFTLCAFHAHPDDEALLTSGTMAKAAAAGHRVILVTATDGALGLADESYGGPEQVARARAAELMASAQALGVDRVIQLGYADSGSGPEFYPDPPGQQRFARVPLEQAAQRVAEILREEQVDVLLTYDRHGGYGHRDHVQVHQVGAAAAELAGTRRVLQATAPRDWLCRVLDLAGRLSILPSNFDRESWDEAYATRSEITHTINVRGQITSKRASMRAHSSQATGGDSRTLAWMLRIPRPIYDLVFGREWYIDPAAPGTRSTDIFEGLS